MGWDHLAEGRHSAEREGGSALFHGQVLDVKSNDICHILKLIMKRNSISASQI